MDDASTGAAPAGEGAPDDDAIDIIVEESGWDDAGVDWPALARTLNALLFARLPDASPGAVAVLLADDAALQALNRDFRGKDRPTNVLSFPAAPGAGMLGDIALAFQTCAAEAQAQGKSFRDHATHLILHGLLHLHGFDHEIDDDEAEAMEAMERAILTAIGIDDPYREHRVLHA